MTTQLDPPRWKGGPPICPDENLPAFVDATEAKGFHARCCPGSRVTRSWHCRFCGHIHFEAKPRSPSGDSSGSSRR